MVSISIERDNDHEVVNLGESIAGEPIKVELQRLADLAGSTERLKLGNNQLYALYKGEYVVARGDGRSYSCESLQITPIEALSVVKLRVEAIGAAMAGAVGDETYEARREVIGRVTELMRPGGE